MSVRYFLKACSICLFVVTKSCFSTSNCGLWKVLACLSMSVQIKRNTNTRETPAWEMPEGQRIMRASKSTFLWHCLDLFIHCRARLASVTARLSSPHFWRPVNAVCKSSIQLCGPKGKITFIQFVTRSPYKKEEVFIGVAQILNCAKGTTQVLHFKFVHQNLRVSHINYRRVH